MFTFSAKNRDTNQRGEISIEINISTFIFLLNNINYYRARKGAVFYYKNLKKRSIRWKRSQPKILVVHGVGPIISSFLPAELGE